MEQDGMYDDDGDDVEMEAGDGANNNGNPADRPSKKEKKKRLELDDEPPLEGYER